jgi:SAM-dependent methyltransferase
MQKEKWAKISELERSWWAKWRSRCDVTKIRAERAKKADKIKSYLRLAFDDFSRLNILEIGPAADGEIFFLGEGRRYAIDPHADFFKREFPDLVDSAVDFAQGDAEALPYPDGQFDAIMILNVLDHCYDPDRVLAEIVRCLRSGGLLLLRVTVYNRFLCRLHQLIGFIDREHPYAFTAGTIERKLRDRFTVIHREFGPSVFPDYNPFKKMVFNLLRSFRIEPLLYDVVARKGGS